MYLFTRRLRLRTGSLVDAMAWATGITEKAHQITGLDISLFSGVFGPEVGSLAFTTMVPDLEALETANDKLAVDGGYLEQVMKGQQYAPGGADDRLMSIVYPTAEMFAELAAAPEQPPQPNYASVVTSACTPGSFRRGVELGVEIAQKAAEISGVPSLFLTDTTGVYGGVNWISGYTDVKQMEQAEAAINSNMDFVDFLDREAKGVYSDVPGATTQLLYRRVV